MPDIDIGECERTKAVIKLMSELSRGEHPAKEKGWTDLILIRNKTD